MWQSRSPSKPGVCAAREARSACPAAWSRPTASFADRGSIPESASVLRNAAPPRGAPARASDRGARSLRRACRGANRLRGRTRRRGAAIRTAPGHATAARRTVRPAASSIRQPQQPAHHAGDPFPVLRLLGELLPPGAGDGVVLGFPVVVGSAPARRNPSALLEAEERGIDRALIELEHVLADLLDAPGDPVTMKRSHCLERLEHHEVQSALENVCLVAHRLSCLTATGE